jgi:hypothetical protein
MVSMTKTAAQIIAPRHPSRAAKRPLNHIISVEQAATVSTAATTTATNNFFIGVSSSAESISVTG